MKKTVKVFSFVEVEIDETKFTEEFMEEYRKHFHDYDILSDHIEHLAYLTVQGYVDSYKSSNFIEGYGEQKEMGILGSIVDTDIEIED